MKNFEKHLRTREFQNKLRWILIFWGFGIILYSSTIIENLSNPDSFWNSYLYKSKFEWEIGLGRFGIKLLQDLRCGVINTSFVTLLSLFFLAVISVLVCELFNVPSTIGKSLIGALIICSPTICSTLTYYYCSDFYMLSYFLSILAVWLLVKSRQNLKNMLLAALCLLFSLSIYQAYITVAIVLCLFTLIFQLLDGDEIRMTIKKGLFMSGAGILSVISYLLLNKQIQDHYHISAIENRGFASMGQIPFKQLLAQLKNSYLYFARYYFGDSMINNEWGYRKEINIIFFTLLIMAAGICFFKAKLTILHRSLVIALALFLPIAFMSIIIIAPEVSIYDNTGSLILPTMNYIYILLILLINKYLHNGRLFDKFQIVCAASAASVIIMLTILDLCSQTYMKYNNDKTFHVASQIAEAIERFPASDSAPPYQICILGTMENGNFPDQYEELAKSVHWLTASHRSIWLDYGGGSRCWRNIIAQHCGYYYEICESEQMGKITELEEVKNMNNFPSENSVILIDHVIVCKLSD